MRDIFISKFLLLKPLQDGAITLVIYTQPLSNIEMPQKQYLKDERYCIRHCQSNRRRPFINAHLNPLKIHRNSAGERARYVPDKLHQACHISSNPIPALECANAPICQLCSRSLREHGGYFLVGKNDIFDRVLSTL